MQIRNPLLCGLVLALPVSAVAGQSDSVRRTRDSIARVGQPLTPVVISASREPLRQERLGVSASVITAADLKVDPALSATDVVGRIPGVYMDANAGPLGPTVIRLRGADESFTKVLMDGVEVNVSGAQFRFQGISVGNIDRVELVRGPQSALHGSNAMAGVVQFFTAAGQPGPMRWSLETRGGSATHNGAHGGFNGAVSGGSETVRYSVGAGLGYDEGIYNIPNRQHAGDLSMRFDVDPAGPLSVVATMRSQYMDSHLPVRNPGTTRAPLDPNQRDRSRIWMPAVTVTLAQSPAWTHQLRASTFWNVFTYADEADSVPPHPGLNYSNGNVYSSSDLRRYAVSYDATRRWAATGGPSGTMTTGVFFERESTGDTVGGGAFTPQHRNQIGALSEISASLTPRVSILGGVRTQRYDRIGWTIVPRGSVRLAVVPDRFSLRVAGGRGFNAPNIQLQFISNPFFVSNAALRPETSWSGEVGAGYESPSGLSLSATYFRQRFHDLIRVVSAPAPDTTKVIARNIGRSNANGVELEGAYLLPRGVRAAANATWITTRILDNSGQGAAQFPIDSALPARPQWLGGASVDVPYGRFHAVARATIVGREIVLSETFNGSRQTLSPYEVYGLTVMTDLGHGLTLNTRVDNLLDRTVPAGYDRRGIPRTWTVGLRVAN